MVREDLIEVLMLDPETDKISDNLVSWTVSSLDSSSMVIDLGFKRPLHVSQGDIPDQLLVEIRFSRYKDIYGGSLPDNVFKMNNIPRQIGSEE